MINQTIYKEYEALVAAFGIDAFYEVYGGYFSYQRQRINDKQKTRK